MTPEGFWSKSCLLMDIEKRSANYAVWKRFQSDSELDTRGSCRTDWSRTGARGRLVVETLIRKKCFLVLAGRLLRREVSGLTG